MPGIKPVQIKDIIRSAVDKARAAQKGTDDLRKAWQSAAGNEAAAHSYPRKKNGDTVVIVVDSSVWMHYLHCNKNVIENKLAVFLATGKGVHIKLMAGE
ncbi:MAG: DciA family protein [Candidatus Omnitrophota bacterium]|jgi:predicted nucleic acid-binding Zn ribbon protein